MPLAVVGSFGFECAHLPFDHPGVTSIPALDVDFGGHLAEQAPVVIIVIGEGGKSPVSISGTG